MSNIYNRLWILIFCYKYDQKHGINIYKNLFNKYNQKHRDDAKQSTK